MLLLTLSHLINVIVVTIVPYLIARDAPAMVAVYGPDTPARRILACLYLTIALASGAALLAQTAGDSALSVRIAAVLFPMQIAYKVLTLPAVGLHNPVVRSNLAIALLHATSLAVATRTGLIVW